MTNNIFQAYVSENYRTDDSYEEHFVIKLLLVSKLQNLLFLLAI